MPIVRPGVRRFVSQGRVPISSQFDGSNDFLNRGAALTGIANGKEGTVSVWFRMDGGDGSQLFLLDSDDAGTGRFSFRRNTNNTMGMVVSNSVNDAFPLNISTSGTFTASATWHHIVVSWKMDQAGARHIEVDGASDISVTTFDDDTLDYTGGDWGVGGRGSTGAGKWNGALAELWFATTYIAPSDYRAFRTPAGKPESLGDKGERVTGSQPVLYLPLDPSRPGVNLGSGGDFSVTGALVSGGPVR